MQLFYHLWNNSHYDTYVHCLIFLNNKSKNAFVILYSQTFARKVVLSPPFRHELVRLFHEKRQLEIVVTIELQQ